MDECGQISQRERSRGDILKWQELGPEEAFALHFLRLVTILSAIRVTGIWCLPSHQLADHHSSAAWALLLYKETLSSQVSRSHDLRRFC